MHDDFAAVADARADAVIAGIAAADDDDVLSLGGDVIAVGQTAGQQRLGRGFQEIDCKVNAGRIAVFSRNIPRTGSAARKHDSIKAVQYFLCGSVCMI